MYYKFYNYAVMHIIDREYFVQSLQAPACHENMIKVGGYILGEFGNLIAGDSRSGPMIQFELLHNKFPFCSIGTRALLLSTYVKFINLYPEIKSRIQNVFEQDTQSRNADLEVQQRSIEYLKLSHLASGDLMVSTCTCMIHKSFIKIFRIIIIMNKIIMKKFNFFFNNLYYNSCPIILLVYCIYSNVLILLIQATILEEMPQFQEKDSLLLSKLFKSAPWMAKLHEPKDDSAATTSEADKINHPKPDVPAPAIATATTTTTTNDQGSVDLLGIIDTSPPPPPIYGKYMYMYSECPFRLNIVYKTLSLLIKIIF